MRFRTWIKRLRGMTLIELLVVMAILALLIGAAVPMVRPALDDRRLREGARSLVSFLSGARARAMALNRNVGVEFEKSNGSNAVMDMYIVETPAPYGGDLLSSRCRVVMTPLPPPSGGVVPMLWFHPFANGTGRDLSTEATVGQFGTTFFVKFDYREPLYVVNRVAPRTLPNNPGVYPNGSTSSYQLASTPILIDLALPYQIYRLPTRANLPPIQLPKGIAVDLGFSGTGTMGTEFSTTYTGASSILMMFRPDGTAMSLNSVTPANVHFLVGRFDQVSPPPPMPASTITNLADFKSLWVTINHKTGVVITTENAGGTVANARQFATAGSAMGGK